jgi:putative transposase
LGGEAQLLSPAKRRQTVEHVRDTLGRDVVTERRACRVLGQARNTQRRKSCVADDEPQLVKRIVWMASEYGRYGYRRITALLRAEGWCVRKAETNLRTGTDPGGRSICMLV